MATRAEWNRLVNTDHELALVEDDLRDVASHPERYYDAAALAQQILYERF